MGNLGYKVENLGYYLAILKDNILYIYIYIERVALGNYAL